MQKTNEALPVRCAAIASRNTDAEGGITTATVYSLSWKGLGIPRFKDFDDEVIASITEQANYQYGTKLAVLIDARLFSWPRGPRGHSGEHSVACSQVTSHPKFGCWLKEVKKKIQGCSGKDGHIDVGVVCKAGINRSVTCTRVLVNVLEGEGVIAQGVHTSEWYWKKHRNLCPGWCRQCANGDGATKKKKDAMEYAKHVWRHV